MAGKDTSKNFLLRLDPATMAKVEAWAAQEFRSVNGQLQWIIADALKRYGRAASPVQSVQSDSNSLKNQGQES